MLQISNAWPFPKQIKNDYGTKKPQKHVYL